MPIPESPRAVGRTLLRDDVYVRLRDAIIDGTLLPGEVLRDGELAEWLGVSRTPVREALLRLSGIGLIVARPGRSTAVSDLVDDSVRAARDVVAAMHGLAARLSVPVLTQEDIDVMTSANDRFARAVERGDIEASMAADEQLHGVFVERSNNPAISTVLSQYEPILRRAEVFRFLSVDRFGSVERHSDLIALCSSGDAIGAAELAYHTWHSLPVNPSTTMG